MKSTNTFVDRLNRTWIVDIDNSMLAELKALGLDLSKIPRDESQESAKAFSASLVDLLIDPEKFGDILSVICQEQIEELGLDARQFARGFNSEALAAASDCVLIAALDHVFRRPELRTMIRQQLPKMWAKVDEAAKAGV